MVLGAAVSVQFGAAVAALLFPRVGVAGVVTLCLVIAAPLGLAAAGTSLLYPVTIGLGAAVAALSSVVPYTLEILALRRMPTSTFAVLMSLGPAIAAAAGFLVLGQSLSLLQVLAVGLVVAASGGAVRSRIPPDIHGIGSTPTALATP